MEYLVDVFVFLGRALHEAAELVGLGEFVEELLGLVGLGIGGVDDVGLVLHEEAGHIGFRTDVCVLLDDSFPFESLLECGPVIRGANNDAP